MWHNQTRSQLCIRIGVTDIRNDRGYGKGIASSPPGVVVHVEEKSGITKSDVK